MEAIDTADIVPQLLKAIKDDFIQFLASYNIIRENTYLDVEKYAEDVGTALVEAFKKNFHQNQLPEGRIYWVIADTVIRPMLEEDYELVSIAAKKVQQSLNQSSGIGLKAQRAPLNTDKIDGILKRITLSKSFEDISWILDEPVKTFSRSVVDDTLKYNIEFQGQAGLHPKVIRKAERHCCKWCANLAGVYTYPDVPKDVYRRHLRCRCSVEYVAPNRQYIQNVWTKEKTDGTIKTKYAPSPQRKVQGIQVNPKTYARLTGELNTNFPGLMPEDGTRILYVGNYIYHVEADGFGGLYIKKRLRLE